MSEPLTPEEEAKVRGWAAEWGDDRVLRLLATLDAARLSHGRGADAKVDALLALIEHGDWEESEGGTVYVGPGEVVVSVATLRAALSVPAPTLPALDAERAGKALDSLDIIDGIVDDTHPEGHGCPLCHELDNLREVLEALRDAV